MIPRDNIDTQAYNRGNFINRFSMIEGMLNSFISHHYFQKQNVEFIEEVMECKYLSFQARKDIFFYLLERYVVMDKKKRNKFKETLNELQKIRNVLAHGSWYVKINNKTGVSQRSKNFFAYRGEEIYVDDLEKSYGEKENIVLDVLEELPGIKDNDEVLIAHRLI